MVKIIDPSSPDAMQDPGAFYGKLGAKCSVAKVDNPDFYVVLGYKNVFDVLNQSDRWTKHKGNLFPTGEEGLALNQDPPAFDDFRKIYAGYMSPKGVKRWAEDAARISNELLDALIPLKSGDLQALFSKPLPLRMAAVALGLPRENYDQYREWTDSFLLSMANSAENTARVTKLMYDFFGEVLAQRRADIAKAGIADSRPEHIGREIPDDFTSILLTARFNGRPLTEEELRRTMRGFFIGSIDTTGALVLHLLYRLLEDRSRWDAVAANPCLIEAAVEEGLRFDPPAIGMFRGAARPIDIDGKTIPEGARAMFAIPSANRDPEMFDHPNEFRLDRPRSQGIRHLTFGSGAHFCPGAWLARSEARIALELIIKRLPKLRLTGPVTRIDPFNFWGYAHFPAAWD